MRFAARFVSSSGSDFVPFRSNGFDTFSTGWAAGFAHKQALEVGTVFSERQNELLLSMRNFFDI